MFLVIFGCSTLLNTIGEYAKGYKQGFDYGIKKCVEILEKKNP